MGESERGREINVAYSLARQNYHSRYHHHHNLHHCHALLQQYRKRERESVCVSGELQPMLVGVRFACVFSALASMSYFWCDGGNKTYFGWIFRMLFSESTTRCVYAMRSSPFYVYFETTISTMRIVDKIYFPCMCVCWCLYMNRIIIYFNLNVFIVHTLSAFLSHVRTFVFHPIAVFTKHKLMHTYT